MSSNKKKNIIRQSPFLTGTDERRTVVSSPIAVNTQCRVLLLHLATLHLRERLDRREPAVFCQRQRHGVQRIGEGTHSILLDRRDLVGSFLHRQRRTDVRGATTVDHAIVLDDIANGTDRIVQRTLRFVDDL